MNLKTRMNLIPLTKNPSKEGESLPTRYGPKAGGVKPRNWDGTLETFLSAKRGFERKLYGKGFLSL